MKNTKKTIIIITFFLIQLLLNFSSYSQTYARLPFSENFDSTWIDQDGIRDVPSIYWRSNLYLPCLCNYGPNWSRDDDTLDIWTKRRLNMYSPFGANGSLHSARHPIGSGSSKSLNLYVDFSTLSGNKILSFWYIHNGPAGRVYVNVSSNGGTAFENKIILDMTTNGWKRIVVDLGNITSSTGVIQFLSYHTEFDFAHDGPGEYDTHDIGLDELKINSIGVDFSASGYNSFGLCGTMPQKMNFTVLSLGNPDTWKWDFNDDGIIDDTTKNPSYTYTTAGIYTVRLIASRGAATDSVIKKDYIEVVAPVVAQFTSDKTIGTPPLTVTFTDQSTNNPTMWVWSSLNDNYSTIQNPTFTYDTAGLYSVWFSVGKTCMNGHSITEYLAKNDYITVVDPIIPWFTCSDTLGTAPMTVSFLDKSTNSPTSWKWDFNNDGIIDDTVQNPSHTYIEAGKYSVKLIASKAGSEETLTKTDYISVEESDNTLVVTNHQEVVNLYPNPTNGELTIRLINIKDEKTTIEIFDMNGKKNSNDIFSNKPIFDFDMNSFLSGIYYIRITCKDKIYVYKILKN